MPLITENRSGIPGESGNTLEERDWVRKITRSCGTGTVPAAGHHGGGAVQVRGAVKTLSCVFGSLRKEAGPTDFL